MELEAKIRERATSTRTAKPLVIIEVTKMAGLDRQTSWAGDQEVLRRYDSPDPDEMSAGRIHTVVIDVHLAN